MCANIPFTSEKEMVLLESFKRVAVLLCPFQWADRKKNIKNEQLMIKRGQL